MRKYNDRLGATSPAVDTFNNLAEEPTDNGHPGPASSDPTSDLGELLSQEHQRMLLLESSISEGVVKARGYRTDEKKADLKRLGFSDAQCTPPGLLIPVHSPRGEIVNYQFRSDMPRIGSNGKPVKYEMPKGSRMTLDVHPFARGMLADPSTPLWITEGVKKGDALVSRGLCVVTLLGVWSWRGTNERGGTVALPEWEHVALNGVRQVYIVFDSDVMLNPQVHAALTRLKGFLEVK
ncbi:MAG: DUF3854 domain-containing protein [Rubrobacter sp.]|nr:DUF3854 domain-containing protein [Rubrobacter sp.]